MLISTTSNTKKTTTTTIKRKEPSKLVYFPLRVRREVRADLQRREAEHRLVDMWAADFISSVLLSIFPRLPCSLQAALLSPCGVSFLCCRAQGCALFGSLLCLLHTAANLPAVQAAGYTRQVPNRTRIRKHSSESKKSIKLTMHMLSMMCLDLYLCTSGLCICI